jgi:hypothetical protein
MTTEREKGAAQLLITRADVSRDELAAAIRTLAAIAAVDLSDLIRPPGFDDLGNANCDTEEWKQWSAADDIRERAAFLARVFAIPQALAPAANCDRP